MVDPVDVLLAWPLSNLGPTQMASVGTLPAPADGTMAPPQVESMQLRESRNGRTQQVAITFSSDVRGTIRGEDLVLTDADGKAVDASGLKMRYSKRKHTAVWSFPKRKAGPMPEGFYRVGLRTANITDAQGRNLDGDANGTPGGDVEPVYVYYRDGGKK